jgi:hypothetical protein
MRKRVAIEKLRHLPAGRLLLQYRDTGVEAGLRRIRVQGFVGEVWPQALQSVGILRHGGQQHLDRDIAIKLRIVGPIHLSHPAFVDLRGDFVGKTPRRVPGVRANCDVSIRAGLGGERGQFLPNGAGASWGRPAEDSSPLTTFGE